MALVYLAEFNKIKTKKVKYGRLRELKLKPFFYFTIRITLKILDKNQYVVDILVMRYEKTY